MDAEVIVVGAGLAGLRSARVLSDAGVDVLVLESEDHVGGRQSTERLHGYTVDRGFQVINPAYPALARSVDLPGLGLNPFGPGVQVRTDDGLRVLADPRREPRQLVGTLRSGLVRPRDLVALGRWLGPTLLRPARAKHGDDTTLSESLDLCHLQGPLRHSVLEPFLAGVLLEDSGSSSARFARLLTRMFALATPGLPAGGVQQLPDSMARGLRVRLSTPVAEMSPDPEPTVRLADGTRLVARAVVLAVGPHQLGSLVADRPAPRMRGVVTWWFGTHHRPSASTMLLVDGRLPRGPVLNSAVMSNAVPSYAPAGRHLVQASSLRRSGTAEASEHQIRTQLSELWGVDARRWDLVARHDIPHALPEQTPGLSLARDNRIAARVFAAGDHLDTASIQGALVSGERAAASILAAFNRRWQSSD